MGVRLAFLCASAFLYDSHTSSAQTNDPTASNTPVMVGGFMTYTLFSGDRVREYLVRMPSAATTGERLAVVFALHCLGCDTTSVRLHPTFRKLTRDNSCVDASRWNTSGRLRRNTVSRSWFPRAMADRGMRATAAEKRRSCNWTMSAS